MKETNLEKTMSLPVVEVDNSCRRAKIFAALADPTRLKIVELLINTGELSGTEIAQRLSISLALFCHHSKTLSEAGLLDIRKEGQTKYNSLNWQLLNACLQSLMKGSRESEVGKESWGSAGSLEEKSSRTTHHDAALLTPPPPQPPASPRTTSS